MELYYLNGNTSTANVLTLIVNTLLPYRFLLILIENLSEPILDIFSTLSAGVLICIVDYFFFFLCRQYWALLSSCFKRNISQEERKALVHWSSVCISISLRCR